MTYSCPYEPPCRVTCYPVSMDFKRISTWWGRELGGLKTEWRNMHPLSIPSFMHSNHIGMNCAGSKQKVADPGDRSHCNNIKIRCIPESVSQAQHSHYAQDLFKCVAPTLTRVDPSIERIHLIHKPAQLPHSVSCQPSDVWILCQNSSLDCSCFLICPSTPCRGTRILRQSPRPSGITTSSTIDAILAPL